MPAIKLMPDYDCYPLWHHNSDEVGVINPADLDLPEQLVNDLLAWADVYDATVKISNPIASGFANAEDEKKFIEQGKELARQLQTALPDREIFYFDISSNKLAKI